MNPATYPLDPFGVLPNKAVDLPCYEVIPHPTAQGSYRLRRVNQTLRFDPGAVSVAGRRHIQSYTPEVTDLIGMRATDQHAFLSSGKGAPVVELEGLEPDGNVYNIATLLEDEYQLGQAAPVFYVAGLASLILTK